MRLMLDLSGLNDYTTIIQTITVVTCIALTAISTTAAAIMIWLRCESAGGG